MAMPDGTYYILKVGNGRGHAGVYKASMAGLPTLWTPYVRVADTDATIAKASSLGATICVPPTDIPHVGRLAVLVDPQGAAIAVMKPDPSMD